MRRVAILAIVGVGVLLLSPAAHATHGLLDGKKLLIKSLPSGNKLVVQGRGFVDSNAGLGDPTCGAPGGGGALLTVDGGGGNAFTIPLPCENWRIGGRSDSHPDYRYKDSSQATCTVVHMWWERKLKAVCKGPQVDYLLGAPQGDISVRLDLGAEPTQNCMLFGPSPTRVVKDGSNGRTYLAKDAPPPPTCP